MVLLFRDYANGRESDLHTCHPSDGLACRDGGDGGHHTLDRNDSSQAHNPAGDIDRGSVQRIRRVRKK